ncbi:MAG: 23S rRNA (uracil(1939)-C(5))-methyltransferase RlmD, partial [Bacteroidales bacterium]|nr:23S rRNA (uracil(1939)-C(5))-methyltransferase RlmD [Bacteroidales bacterium]
GGCKWQELRYDEQLKMKEKQVRDALEHIGKVSTEWMRPICGSEKIFHYRNKMEYTFSNRRWRTREELEAGAPNAAALGFHLPGLFDKVLDIERCALQADPSNAIRLEARRYALEHGLPFYDARTHEGYLRTLVIRCSGTGEWMVLLVVAQDRPEWLFPMLDNLKRAFPQITSLHYIVNEKMNDSYSDQPVTCYYGKECVEEVMEGYGGAPALHFAIHPKSFYQTNAPQAYRLYSFVAEFADLNGTELVYDLYTGTGTIALFLARMCRHVVGVEYVEDAVTDARGNAQVNGIGNAEFYAGDMAKVLDAAFVAQHGRPDVVVVDPPRAGMAEKVVWQLLEMRPKKIVYVSCNPATQARDLLMLAEAYDVRRLQPVDMFPHTQHVENVAELILRQ